MPVNTEIRRRSTLMVVIIRGYAHAEGELWDYQTKLYFGGCMFETSRCPCTEYIYWNPDVALYSSHILQSQNWY